MTKLDEQGIIQIFQKKLNKKEFVAEDIEVFNLGKTKFAVKTDTLVQSTDIPSKMKLVDAARKSVVACVSDFAAKGIRPQYGIISVNIPRSIKESEINEIARGFKIAANEYDITILGGDTNEGKEIVFNVCIFGIIDKIIRRKGAKIGDIIFVTGPFGYTPIGLDFMLEKRCLKKEIFSQKSLNAFVKPKPRLKFGLKNKKYFSSSMDSSDGLSTTLNELAKQSKKKIIINKIPFRKDLQRYAKAKKINLNNLIFHGGEEYEFVFTTSVKNRKIINKNAKLLKTPIIEIGYITSGKGVIIYHDDKMLQLKDKGWKHFK